MRTRLCLAALTLLLVLPARSACAQGGPPMITDDPDTPGPGYWEINLSMFVERSREHRLWEIPRIDINYGLGRRIQLKYEAPWLRQQQAGERAHQGIGASTAGVKWRFLGQEGQPVAWSVYPQVTFPTSRASADKGLVEEGTRLRLPTELTVEIKHAEINVEAGRDFARGLPGWIWGISSEGHVFPRLELIAELHGEGVDHHRTELIANVGLRGKLSRQLILMLAGGRALRGGADTRAHLLIFTGLQINLPGQYSFGDAAHNRAAWLGSRVGRADPLPGSR